MPRFIERHNPSKVRMQCPDVPAKEKMPHALPDPLSVCNVEYDAARGPWGGTVDDSARRNNEGCVANPQVATFSTCVKIVGGLLGSTKRSNKDIALSGIRLASTGKQTLCSVNAARD